MIDKFYYLINLALLCTACVAVGWELHTIKMQKLRRRRRRRYAR